MKTLVTGGLGFIGSNFCRHMITTHSDCEVINIDKMGIGANPTNLKDLQKENCYTFIEGDICNPKRMEQLVKKVDTIVNIAAETHVDRSISDPKSFMHNNTVGTFTVLEAIRRHNKQIRFVQVSTDEIYGEISRGSFTEKDRPKPSNPYSASKASADMFVHAYCKTFDLDASITRCTNNFGPYQFPEKLIPKTIIRALRDLQIPVYGTGRNIRDWLYVQDHCEAIDLILSKGEPNEVYNISSGNETTNLEIIKKILHILGKDENLISFVQDRPGHDLRYSLDSSKIKTQLGWTPRFAFKKALEKTTEWYRNNEKWWNPLATDEILDPTPWKPRDAQ